jgi:UPF0042 nucleotide-binding protein
MSVDLVIVTGMSGAGRSTAAHCLEDLGWYVVDNLPPAMLRSLLESGPDRVAVVTDLRTRGFVEQVQAALDDLELRGTSARLLFLEASDEALVRRFDSVRRPHPLQGTGRLVDGIERERSELRPIRERADLVIDSSVLNVYALRTRVQEAFDPVAAALPLHLTLMSFGFKYGLPVDADLVLDCRFLPNPHWVSELRPQTGRDAPVRDYVLGQPGAQELLDGYERVLRTLAEGYVREGKRYALLAVGCTGGKHRSVAMSQALADRMADAGLDVRVQHRDLGRE